MGRGSRSEIKADIRRGKVSVNGGTVKSGSVHIDAGKDLVEHLGEVVRYRRFVYLMLNKPAGYVSATNDNLHRTVLDCVPESLKHFSLFPVGRLDIDTTGLLILTNDGDFAHRVISPVSRIDKVYLASLEKPLTEEERTRLLTGVDITTKRGKHHCKAKELTSDEGQVRITIDEGKFHQVKKMFEAAGHRVVSLRRISIGGLDLDETLNPGECKELDETDLTRIFAMPCR